MAAPRWPVGARRASTPSVSTKLVRYGGHPHCRPNPQHTHGNDDPFAKVKFMIPTFYGLYDAEAYSDWQMTVDNKFSPHLVPEQYRVR
jgi:hypothetical protein